MKTTSKLERMGLKWMTCLQSTGLLVTRPLLLQSRPTERTCVGCRTQAPATTLLRVVAQDGSKHVASVPVTYTNQSYIQDMQKIVLAAIQAKVSKSYPKHTALIVDCSLITLFLRDEWETLVTLVRAEMPKHELMEIYLTAGQVGYAAFL